MSVVVGMRNVKDTPTNRMLDALILARNLATHTIRICTNEKVFNPQYKKYTNMIIKTATDIYLDARDANDIRMDSKVHFEENWKQRRKLQKRAIRKCRRLLAMTDLAKTLFHLKSGKVKYWQQLTIETRDKLRSWHESDCGRYE